MAAAKAGLHVFTEKPMCFSVAEGWEMIAAARAAGRVLMVAYNKRHDPAYLRFAAEARSMQDIRLVRVTTLEAPFLPYVAHYRIHKPGPPPESHQAAFSRETEKRIAASIGDADPLSTRAYQLVLLDSMVHEFYALRGVLGEPMEFAFFAPDSRLILEFPSPYLRNAPTMLVHEGGEIGNRRSWRTEEINSYEENFRQELIHFHQCVTTSEAPTTCAEDALRDIALCQSVIDVHRRRLPRPHPTDPGAG